MAETAGAPSIRSWSPPRLRPVLFLTGGMLAALGVLMLVPTAVDALAGTPDWQGFAASSALTLACGIGLLWVTHCRLTGGLTIRQSFVLTPLSWLAVSAFGAIPLFLSDYDGLAGNYTNAFFEAMSGLTTTGSTVLTGLDTAPPGMLLWRALLQWVGGIGIIAAAVAILPALGVGGMQLFRTESSDRSEKVMPRARPIAKAIGLVYLTLTVLCAAAYWLAGMTTFDAVAHALTTISTGGYLTSDASMANWDSPAIHWIATVFMLSGSIPFVLYVRMLRGERDTLRDSQVRTLLGILVVVIVGLTAWLVVTGRYGLADAARHAAFNVVSILSTTGFATTDYGLWGGAVVGLFFGLMLVGGCAGSPSGGMKIFRFEVMALMLRAQFLRLLYPRGVFPRVYAGRLLPDDVVGSAVVFFSLYLLCCLALTIALMALNLDFLASASAAVTALSNVGPGLGEIIGPAGNFSTVPDAAKWLLCFGMLLGRLELFTVLVLFMPRFWRG